VLKELRMLEQSQGSFDEHRLTESRRIVDSISAPDAIEELLQALYLGTIRVSSAQLGEFLGFLRGGALAPLLRASESMDHRQLQDVLRVSVQGIASQNREALIQLLEDDDPLILAAAAKLVGDMQVVEGAVQLSALLRHDEPPVRLAAIEAAVAIRASTVASSLEPILRDQDRDVRIAAAKALGELRYSPGAGSLSDVIKSKQIRQADIAEKVAVFEAFGRTAGESGAALLGDLLNKKGFLGKRESSEIRAAAALGLGQIDTATARASLEAATQDEDPVVRSNVNRALRPEG